MRNRTRFIAALVIAAACPGAGAAERSPADLLADANRRFERGDFQGAADAYEACLDAYPGRWEILFNLARSYHELDDPSPFEATVRRMLAADPARAETFVLMGRRYQWEGRFEDAERAYRQATKLEADNDEALAGLADVCLARGDRDEAVGYLEAIVERHPRRIPYLWMLARATFDREQQAAIYRRIMEETPGGDLVAGGRLALLEARSEARFLEIEGLDKPERVRLFYTPAKNAKTKGPFTFREDDPGMVEGWASQVATPNTPYIRARINGQGPFKFLVDTGTQGVHISRALADKLGLRSYGKSRFEGLGGASVLYGEIVFLDSLRIGDVVVRHVPAEAIDLVGIGDGILNPAVLRDVRVQFENSRRSIRLSRWPPPGEADPIVLQADGRRGDPVTLSFLSFHGHTVIRIEIQGMPANALLDTGAESTVLDTSVLENIPALESFPISGYGVTLQGLTGEVRDARVVRDVQLVLASENLRVQDLFAADLRRMTNFYGPEIHAVLGMRQLRNFDITFDYRNNQITFQRLLR